MTNRLAVVLVALSAASTAWTDTRPPTASAKLVLLGRSPAFHALVDGHDAILELDTGSFELRLSPDFAEKNRIDVMSVKLRIGDAPEETCKPIIEALAEPDVPTFADRFATKADGIVGLDILRKYAVGIDSLGQQVTFWLGGKVTSETADNWTALPDERQPPKMAELDLTSRTEEDWFRVQTKVNGRTLDFVFDTGTAFSTINPSLVPLLQLKRVADTEVEEIGHTETLPIVEAKTLTFGPLTATFPILNVESQDDTDSDGILGSESLGQGKFLIDMPDHKLYVRRLKMGHYSNPLEQRLRSAGLDVFPDSKNRLLVLVQPSSAAQKAGIQSGDILISFGKVNVEDLQKALSGFDKDHPTAAMLTIGLQLLQKSLVITIQRDDGSRVVLDLPSVDRK